MDKQEEKKEVQQQQQNEDDDDDDQGININNIVNDQQDTVEQSSRLENSDLNFVQHTEHFKDVTRQRQVSMVDKFKKSQIEFNIVQKHIKGLTIVDIHQIYNENGVKQITDPEFLKFEVLRSLKSLQKQAEVFYSYQPTEEEEEKAQEQKDTIVKKKKTYKELQILELKKQYNQETMKFLNLDDMHNVAEFVSFDINTNHWPYLLSYEIKLSVPVEINKTTKEETIYCLFCEFEGNAHKNYEIFDAFSPHEVNVIVSFWVDKEKSYCKEVKEMKKLQAQKIAMEQNNLSDTLEITQSYFDTFYQKLLNIGSGGFAEVDLYYDTVERRLLAVKQPVDSLDKFQRAQGYDRVPITLLEEERLRIIKAIREYKFEDKQMKQLFMSQRNILREIKRLWQLNSVKDDGRSSYVNKLVGLVVFDQNQQYHLKQKNPQSNNKSNQLQQSVKMVFQYFGGCEVANKALTCDLHLYFLRNKGYYADIDQQKKTNIIRSLYKKIFEAIEFLHDQQVMLRDLKDDNILVRRKFKNGCPGESEFDILLIDFGMSKKNKMKIPFFDVEISRRISIPYDQNGIVFRHPRFIYGQDKFEKKDDIFALGIMLLRLYDNIEFPITNIDEDIRAFSSYITGIPYFVLYGYYKKTSKAITEKKCMEYYDKIPKNIKEIKNSAEYKKFFNITK